MRVFLLVKVKESYTMEGNVGRTLVEQREREPFSQTHLKTWLACKE
jgi:hypothetical protein